MKKILYYALATVLGLWGLLSVFRVAELLLTGSLSAYGAGRLVGSLVLGVLLLFAAWKVVGLARRVGGPAPRSI